MAIASFLISLAGATMLLLYAVRMVRTGIERSYGASFQRRMTGQRNHLQSSVVGTGMAVMLQSSAAVALLTTGFMSAGLELDHQWGDPTTVHLAGIPTVVQTRDGTNTARVFLRGEYIQDIGNGWEFQANGGIGKTNTSLSDAHLSAKLMMRF